MNIKDQIYSFFAHDFYTYGKKSTIYRHFEKDYEKDADKYGDPDCRPGSYETLLFSFLAWQDGSITAFDACSAFLLFSDKNYILYSFSFEEKYARIEKTLLEPVLPFLNTCRDMLAADYQSFFKSPGKHASFLLSADHASGTGKRVPSRKEIKIHINLLASRIRSNPQEVEARFDSAGLLTGSMEEITALYEYLKERIILRKFHDYLNHSGYSLCKQNLKQDQDNYKIVFTKQETSRKSDQTLQLFSECCENYGISSILSPNLYYNVRQAENAQTDTPQGQEPDYSKYDEMYQKLCDSNAVNASMVLFNDPRTGCSLQIIGRDLMELSNADKMKEPPCKYAVFQRLPGESQYCFYNDEGFLNLFDNMLAAYTIYRATVEKQLSDILESNSDYIDPEDLVGQGLEMFSSFFNDADDFHSETDLSGSEQTS